MPSRSKRLTAFTFHHTTITTTRMLNEAFMQRALGAVLLLGPLCAALGVFVTARRMAFFSDTIAHGALTGVALGIWLGLADLTAPMILFSLVIAAGILYLKEKTDLLTDTIMALQRHDCVGEEIGFFFEVKNSSGDHEAEQDHRRGKISKAEPNPEGHAGQGAVRDGVAEKGHATRCHKHAERRAQ